MNTKTAEPQQGYRLSLDQVQEGVRVVNQLKEEDWKQFVDQHPQGNIFHTPEMFHVFERARGFRPALWAAVRGEAQIEALFLPVQVSLSKLLGPLTTRTISYGSVLCLPSEAARQSLSMLLKAYVRQNRTSSLFTELRNVSDIQAEQPVLGDQGFAYEEHLNYLIDLNRPSEEVFSGIGARTRKNIRHGLNKGEVTVREVTELEQVGICYHLLNQTYQTARVPLADRSLFEAAFELLRPKGMIRFTLAYVGDVPAAASVELLYKDVMYGWYGGMDRSYSKYVPNELLMWHILKWGSENGYSLYDFGGAGKPNEEYGVRDFKAKFGGKLVCYGRNTFVHLPGVLWLSRQGYQILRHLFIGRFPGQ